MKHNFTKAETLSFISQKLKKKKFNNLIIPKFIYFTKSYYLKNKNKCYLNIKKTFGKKMKQQKVRYIYGDVSDQERCIRASQDIDIIVHAAAMKHIPFCEYNPFEATKTNVFGT